MLQTQREKFRCARTKYRGSKVQSWSEATVADLEDGFLVAGQVVPAGRYRRVDVSWGETISLTAGDILPASLDGHVAVYERVPLWQLFAMI